MNVSLTPQFEHFIEEKVKSGLYHSQSEVVRDALRLLMEQDQVLRERREQVDAKIKRGIAQLERGESVDGESFFEGVKNRTVETPRMRA